MLTFSPSLRHHAVIRILRRSLKYSIWLVSDRRSDGSRELLLVPSRFVAWPIMYQRLSKLEPRLVRLRNGKVAFLILENEIEQVVSNASASAPKTNLDPLAGFIPASRTRFKAIWMLVGLSSLVIVLFATTGSGTPETKNKNDEGSSACLVEPYPIEINLDEFKAGKFTKDGVKFNFAALNQNGGLYSIRIRRLCDGKLYQGKAWKSKSGLVLSQ